ncbi:MAG: PQQ-binding-like beta-propeller repeat protein, partial [Thermoleophilia bacterium]|nr:PQQ-binding-like beta-propeller repeat protein [Thermoleophilia bacterium]
IFGSHDGHVYGVDPSTHKAAWTVRGHDAFKGGVAVSGDTLYAGNYDGNLYAASVHDGSVKWVTQTRRDFSFGGALYSTPTVAYGRVYVGSTDGRVYAIGAKSGSIRWVHSTGDWVYASPAVGNHLVFIGSYDGRMYALDAKTGDERWKFEAGGRVAGSATIIDGAVFFSTLGNVTYALSLSGGVVKWSLEDGRLGGIVTDGQWVFLTGDRTVYAYRTVAAPSAVSSTANVVSNVPHTSSVEPARE